MRTIRHFARHAPVRRAGFDGYESLEPLEPRQMLSGADDRFENNDLPRVTLRRPEGVVNSPNLGSVTGTRVIRTLRLMDNADVYRVRLADTGAAGHEVRINFNNRMGNLDLQLVGANGTRIIRQSQLNRSPETISLEGIAPGNYYIRVLGRNGATSPNYSMTLTMPPPFQPQPPTEDAYEGNDSFGEVNQRPAGGVNSPNLGGIAGQRTLSSLKLSDTFDIFKFSTNGTGATPSFVRVNGNAPLNLVLFSAGETTLRTAAAYLGQNQIDLSNLPAGEYFVQVAHYALTPGVWDYTLEFNV